jgi:hypothetical protein
MTTIYSEQWGNGLVAHTIKKPTESGAAQYAGMRVLMTGELSGVVASPLGKDAYPDSDSPQHLNPLAGNTREFSTFADGLEWLEQDLPNEALS